MAGKTFTLLTRMIARRGIPTPERGYDSLGEVVTDLARAFNEVDSEIARLNGEAGSLLAEIRSLKAENERLALELADRANVGA